MLPVFYTPEEVGKMLKMTRRQVYVWLTTGKLKGYRTGVGGAWRITEDEIARFIGMESKVRKAG